MAEVTALRSNALPYPVYGKPWVEVFPIFDADGDLVTSAASLDSEISLNGDSFVDCTNEATEIGGGMYRLTLTDDETLADVVTVIVKTSTSGAKTTPLRLFPRKLPIVRAGTAAGGAAGYVTLDASASAIDDFYNGMLVQVDIDGTIECRIITDYTGSNKQAAVTPAWNTAPDSDDTFVIHLVDAPLIPAANLTAIDGLLTNGNNATLNLKQLNIVNSAGTALVAQSSGGNGHGFAASGNGTGEGISATGGATGNGFEATGGSASGDGIKASTPTLGDGISATGAGVAKAGARFGGPGPTSGLGIVATGLTNGITAAATSDGHGLLLSGAGSAGDGLQSLGAGSGNGITALAGATGYGVKAIGGATSGHGLAVSAPGNNGDGINVTANDGDGLSIAGGTNGDGLVAAGAGSGVDIRGDITGNVTGNLSGSIGSYTGNTPQTGDAYALLGTPFTATIAGDLLDIDNEVDDIAVAVNNLAITGSALVKEAASFTNTGGGTVTTGTYADTASANDVLHTIQATAGGTIDLYYEFNIGTYGSPSRVNLRGYLLEAAPAGGDSVGLYVWRWDTAAWELMTPSVFVGVISPAYTTHTDSLLGRHVGTGGDVGKVRIRLYTTTAEGTTTSVSIDQVTVEYAESISSSVAQILADTDDLQTRIPPALVNNKMDASVSDITAAGLADLLAVVVEADGSITLQQALQVILAFIAGEASGGGTSEVVFTSPNGDSTRITMTVDADGNRSAVALAFS